MARLGPDTLEVVQKTLHQSKIGRTASSTDLWAAFRDVVSQIQECIFVLDGFDKYSQTDDCRAGFLQDLKTRVAHTASRIIVASRDEPDIRSELTSTNPYSAEPTLLWYRISQDDTHADINLYSKSLVDSKLQKKDNSFRRDLAAHLTHRCEGMFLWIRMQEA